MLLLLSVRGAEWPPVLVAVRILMKVYQFVCVPLWF